LISPPVELAAREGALMRMETTWPATSTDMVLFTNDARVTLIGILGEKSESAIKSEKGLYGPANSFLESAAETNCATDYRQAFLEYVLATRWREMLVD